MSMQKQTKKTQRSFTSLKEIIDAEVRKIQPKDWQDLRQLKPAWPKLLGPSIAQNTRLLFLKKQILHVAVTNQTWACELNLLKEELLKKINQEKLTLEPITDLQFSVAT